MKRITVLSGAGISAESGLKTFRDSNGLWEGHDVNKVATPEGFMENPKLVLDFYNQRRKQLLEVQPNKAHFELAALEKDYKVTIVTQNVDDLHERAGSTDVIHLHGELLKVRSTGNPNHVLRWEKDIQLGDCDEFGFQLRPHIVWFGEEVPALMDAIPIVQNSDLLVIIGTSLQVYPAAGLLYYSKTSCPVIYIDPNPSTVYDLPNHIEVIPEKATVGVDYLKEKLRIYL